jgi:hypothetical protein
MTERPVNSDRAVPAPTSKHSNVLPSLVVATLSFLILLGMFVGVWLLTSRHPLAAATGEIGSDTAAPAPNTELATLIDNNNFIAPLPPAGDRSVTYQYTIVVKVLKSRRGVFDRLVSAEGGNMLPAIREQVRKIIAAEDYMKLRAEQLEGVKRHIRFYLNGLMDGEVVEDVIFDKWNVIS